MSLSTNYYYFLQNWCGKNNHIIIKKIQSASILIQKIFKINRLRNVKFELVKSEQWFSITHNTAEYVLEQYPRYKKYFLHSFIPDESFIYTIINDSYLVNNMEKISLRYIDWNRGGPYIFGIDDFAKEAETTSKECVDMTKGLYDEVDTMHEIIGRFEL